MQLLVAAVIVLRAAIAGEPQPASKASRPLVSYRAYWLSGPQPETQDGYRTLLVTPWPVEMLGGHVRRSKLLFDDTAMTLRTYQRDSLWDNAFKPVQRCTGVDTEAKIIILDDVSFNYEAGDLSDVVRLLKHPLGTIPVHRKARPLAGAEQTARAFRLLLEDQIAAETE